MHVEVVDLHCDVFSVGIRIPKTVTEFVVYFKDDAGDTHKIPVWEEIYEEFEKGQSGVLTLLDGQFFSFVPDDLPPLDEI